MVFILQDEILQITNIFINDLPIKGPASCCPDKFGKLETLPENTGIRHFIWEHAVDVNRITTSKNQVLHFLPRKLRTAFPKLSKCMPQGRLPDDGKVSEIKNWPLLTTTKEIRGFLGLCGTVQIWIRLLTTGMTPHRVMEEVQGVYLGPKNAGGL